MKRHEQLVPDDLLPLHKSLEVEFRKMQGMIHNKVSKVYLEPPVFVE